MGTRMQTAKFVGYTHGAIIFYKESLKGATRLLCIFFEIHYYATCPGGNNEVSLNTSSCSIKCQSHKSNRAHIYEILIFTKACGQEVYKM